MTRRYRDPDELHDAFANGDREPPLDWRPRAPAAPRPPQPPFHLSKPIDPTAPCGSTTNPHVVRSALDRVCANCGKPTP